MTYSSYTIPFHKKISLCIIIAKMYYGILDKKEGEYPQKEELL
jgi:hypothetical protein